MKEFARILRKSQTNTERALWFHLKKRGFYRYKFRRQHVIGPYIVDFICLNKGLIIEIDGSHHLNNQEYDEDRTLFLNSQGYRVLRFWNQQIVSELHNVLRTIYIALNSPHPALRAPSPQQVGEKE